MHEIILSINNLQKSIPFPSSWNELSTPELNIVAEGLTGKFSTPEQAQAYIFLSILTIRCKDDKQARAAIKNLSPEQCTLQGLPAIEFLSKENKLTTQPYPTIKLAGKVYHGPDDNFDNIHVAEFEATEMHYQAFIETKDQLHLARLASELWRPKGQKYTWLKNGEYINYDAEVLGMEPLFLQLPFYQLFSIFLWYSGCRETLPKIFIYCFDKSENSGQPDPLAFTKCIHAAAGAKYGNIDKVSTMLLKAMFLGMDLERKAAIAE